MNHISFEVGDWVRHKITQIEGEIVQMEESLAMPHAWVIEPSVCEINPPKLYRYVDLEKVEEQEDKQTLTEQLLEDKKEVFSPCNDSTSNQLLEDKKNDSTSNQLLEDKKEVPTHGDDSILNQLLEDKKEVFSPCNDLTSNQLLEDKKDFVVPSNDSTSNQLLEDKKEVFSLCNDSTSNQLLEDKQNDSTSNQLLEDKQNDSTSNQLLADNFPHTLSQPLPQRRVKGDGSGCIYWRTVVRNGLEYQQAYYQYEFWQNGQCLLKSTKYIPKKLLKQVLKLNQDKAPVSEILEVLGVFMK